MDYIAVTFRSRSHTMKMKQYLSGIGVSCEIINTPKEAGVGCGLSVKIMPETFNFVKRIVHQSNLTSFAGFFFVKQIGNKRVVKSI